LKLAVAQFSGKISDSRTPPFTQVSYPDTQAVIEQARTITLVLKPGREVVVTTRDNRQISGKYQRVEGAQEDLALKISDKDASLSVPIRDMKLIRLYSSIFEKMPIDNIEPFGYIPVVHFQKKTIREVLRLAEFISRNVVNGL